ncbi:MAG: hypothetical protein MUQ18_00185, partial [Loktanella sp.]|nr:hypothetical protein [Loktanella sp.]
GQHGDDTLNHHEWRNAHVAGRSVGKMRHPSSPGLPSSFQQETCQGGVIWIAAIPRRPMEQRGRG